jgi:hypothetical protein
MKRAARSARTCSRRRPCPDAAALPARRALERGCPPATTDGSRSLALRASYDKKNAAACPCPAPPAPFAPPAPPSVAQTRPAASRRVRAARLLFLLSGVLVVVIIMAVVVVVVCDKSVAVVAFKVFFFVARAAAAAAPRADAERALGYSSSSTARHATMPPTAATPSAQPAIANIRRVDAFIAARRAPSPYASTK